VRVPAFLEELRGRDIQVWADGERLRCNGPAGLLTPDLRDQLQQLKGDILEFLRSAEAVARQQRAIVPLQPRGNRTPLFAAPGHNGDVFCFRALAQHVGDDQPLYGLQPPGVDGHGQPLERVEDLAAYFAAQIRAFRPEGPYILAGYCAGGMIAFELGRQLLQAGATVEFVALFGAPYTARYRRLPMLWERFEHAILHARAAISLPAGERWPYVAGKLQARKAQRAATTSDPVLALRAGVERATLAAARRYSPGHFAGRLCLLVPCRSWVSTINDPLGWRSAAACADEYFGPDGCTYNTMLLEPHAPVFAELFRLCRDGTLGEDGGRCRVVRGS